MLELQSPFIIPDLFTSRVLEAQSFCYAKSALANSCQDLVSQDKSAASLYIAKQSIQSRRIQTFFWPLAAKNFQGVVKYSAAQLARVSLSSCNPFDFDWSSPKRGKHLSFALFRWMKSLSLASVNACCCVLSSPMIANTRDEFQDCASNRSLQYYGIVVWSVFKTVRIERGSFCFLPPSCLWKRLNVQKSAL